MSDRPLCVNPRCRIPRRHGPACSGQDCGGCLIAWAADGLRLCRVCACRLGENAGKLAELHGELELVLRGAGQSGERAGKPGAASPPRDAVVAMRAEIRQVLVSWCRLVAEERGLGLPRDEITDIAAWVARHAEWLAAQEYAGEVADELSALVGRAWGLAYPDGVQRIRVGPCPRCGGVEWSRGVVVLPLPAGVSGPPRLAGCLVAVVRDKDQDRLPAEVACDLVAEHRWTAPQWRQLDREVMARRRMAA